MRRRRGEALPPNTRYVGRPTVFGNPFKVVGDDAMDRKDAVAAYALWIGHPDRAWLVEKVKKELRGMDLACWCAPEACHADVLLEIANDTAKEAHRG